MSWLSFVASTFQFALEYLIHSILIISRFCLNILNSSRFLWLFQCLPAGFICCLSISIVAWTFYLLPEHFNCCSDIAGILFVGGLQTGIGILLLSSAQINIVGHTALYILILIIISIMIIMIILIIMIIMITSKMLVTPGWVKEGGKVNSPWSWQLLLSNITPLCLGSMVVVLMIIFMVLILKLRWWCLLYFRFQCKR